MDFLFELQRFADDIVDIVLEGGKFTLPDLHDESGEEVSRSLIIKKDNSNVVCGRWVWNPSTSEYSLWIQNNLYNLYDGIYNFDLTGIGEYSVVHVKSSEDYEILPSCSVFQLDENNSFSINNDYKNSAAFTISADNSVTAPGAITIKSGTVTLKNAVDVSLNEGTSVTFQADLNTTSPKVTTQEGGEITLTAGDNTPRNITVSAAGEVTGLANGDSVTYTVDGNNSNKLTRVTEAFVKLDVKAGGAVTTTYYDVPASWTSAAIDIDNTASFAALQKVEFVNASEGATLTYDLNDTTSHGAMAKAGTTVIFTNGKTPDAADFKQYYQLTYNGDSATPPYTLTELADAAGINIDVSAFAAEGGADLAIKTTGVSGDNVIGSADTQITIASNRVIKNVELASADGALVIESGESHYITGAKSFTLAKAEYPGIKVGDVETVNVASAGTYWINSSMYTTTTDTPATTFTTKYNDVTAIAGLAVGDSLGPLSSGTSVNGVVVTHRDMSNDALAFNIDILAGMFKILGLRNAGETVGVGSSTFVTAYGYPLEITTDGKLINGYVKAATGANPVLNVHGVTVTGENASVDLIVSGGKITDVNDLGSGETVNITNVAAEDYIDIYSDETGDYHVEIKGGSGYTFTGGVGNVLEFNDIKAPDFAEIKIKNAPGTTQFPGAVKVGNVVYQITEDSASIDSPAVIETGTTLAVSKLTAGSVILDSAHASFNETNGKTISFTDGGTAGTSVIVSADGTLQSELAVGDSVTYSVSEDKSNTVTRVTEALVRVDVETGGATTTTYHDVPEDWTTIDMDSLTALSNPKVFVAATALTYGTDATAHSEIAKTKAVVLANGTDPSAAGFKQYYQLTYNGDSANPPYTLTELADAAGINIDVSAFAAVGGADLAIKTTGVSGDKVIGSADTQITIGTNTVIKNVELKSESDSLVISYNESFECNYITGANSFTLVKTENPVVWVGDVETVSVSGAGTYKINSSTYKTTENTHTATFTTSENINVVTAIAGLANGDVLEGVYSGTSVNGIPVTCTDSNGFDLYFDIKILDGELEISSNIGKDGVFGVKGNTFVVYAYLYTDITVTTDGKLIEGYVKAATGANPVLNAHGVTVTGENASVDLTVSDGKIKDVYDLGSGETVNITNVAAGDYIDIYSDDSDDYRVTIKGGTAYTFTGDTDKAFRFTDIKYDKSSNVEILCTPSTVDAVKTVKVGEKSYKAGDTNYFKLTINSSGTELTEGTIEMDSKSGSVIVNGNPVSVTNGSITVTKDGAVTGLDADDVFTVGKITYRVYKNPTDATKTWLTVTGSTAEDGTYQLQDGKSAKITIAEGADDVLAQEVWGNKLPSTGYVHVDQAANMTLAAIADTNGRIFYFSGNGAVPADGDKIYAILEKTGDAAYSLTADANIGNLASLEVDTAALSAATLHVGLTYMDRATVFKSGSTFSITSVTDSGRSGFTIAGNTIAGLASYTLTHGKVVNSDGATVTTGNGILAFTGAGNLTEVSADGKVEKLANNATVTYTGLAAGAALSVNGSAFAFVANGEDNNFVVQTTAGGKAGVQNGTIMVSTGGESNGVNDHALVDTVSNVKGSVDVKFVNGTAQVTGLTYGESLTISNGTKTCTYSYASSTIFKQVSGDGTTTTTTYYRASTVGELGADGYLDNDGIDANQSGLEIVTAIPIDMADLTNFPAGTYSAIGVATETAAEFAATITGTTAASRTIEVKTELPAGVILINTTTKVTDRGTDTVYTTSDGTDITAKGVSFNSANGVISSATGTIALQTGELTASGTVNVDARTVAATSTSGTIVTYKAGAALARAEILLPNGDTVSITESSNNTDTRIDVDGDITGLDGGAAVSGLTKNQSVTTTGDGKITINGRSFVTSDNGAGVTYTVAASGISAVTGLRTGATLVMEGSYSNSSISMDGTAFTAINSKNGITFRKQGSNTEVDLDQKSESVTVGGFTYAVEKTTGNGVTVYTSEGKARVAGLRNGDKVTVTSGTNTATYEVSDGKLAIGYTDSNNKTVSKSYTLGGEDSFTTTWDGTTSAPTSTGEAGTSLKEGSVSIGSGDTALGSVVDGTQLDAQGNVTTDEKKAVATIETKDDSLTYKATSTSKPQELDISDTNGMDWNIDTSNSTGRTHVDAGVTRDANGNITGTSPVNDAVNVKTGSGKSEVAVYSNSDSNITGGSGNLTATVGGRGDHHVTAGSGSKNELKDNGTGENVLTGGSGKNTFESSNENGKLVAGSGKNTFKTTRNVTNKVEGFTYGKDEASMDSAITDLSRFIVGEGTINYGGKASSGELDLSSGTGTGDIYAVTILDSTGKKTNVGWTGEEGGNLDASSETRNLVLIGDQNGDAKDLLIGGKGKDVLYAGEGDIVAGGEGTNELHLKGTGISVGFGTEGAKDEVTGFLTGFDESEADNILLMNASVAEDITLSFDGKDAVLKTGNTRMTLDSIQKNSSTNAAELLIGGAKVAAIEKGTTAIVTEAAYADVYFGTGSAGIDFKAVSDDLTVDLSDTSRFRNIGSVTGGAGNTLLMGGGSKVTLVSGGGNTSLWGGTGNAMLVGSKDAKDEFFFFGESGKDTISGFTAGTGDTSDVLNLYGSSLTDLRATENGVEISTSENSKVLLQGLKANDKLQWVSGEAKGVAKIGSKNEANTFTYEADVTNYFGGNKSDTLSVSRESNSVWLDNVGSSIEVVDASSSTGNNLLAGSSDSQTIIGGRGSNTLWGGAGGNDILTGGSSYNEFYFGMGEGNDIITGSNDGDKIMLYNVTVEDLNAQATGMKDGNMVIALKDGSSLTIQNYDRQGATTFHLADGTYSYDKSTGTWNESK